MNERLPKRLESFLVEIAPHQGEAEYIQNRFDSMSFDQQWDEIALLDGLERRGMIELAGERVESKTAENGIKRTIKFRTAFLLLADGDCYIRDIPKMRAVRVLRTSFEVIACAGAISAIVNLVLFVLWH